MSKRICALFVLLFNLILLHGQQIEAIIASNRAVYQNEEDLQKKASLAADLAWYYSQVNIDSALLYGQTSLRIARQIHDDKLIAQAYNDLATVYLVKGEYQSSINVCDSAMSIRYRLHDSLGIASLNFKKGNAFNKLGAYDSTMHYYFKAHAYYSEAKDSSVLSNIESNISATYFLMGNLDKALSYLEAPIHYYRSSKQYPYLANSILNKGSIQLASKDTTSALHSFNETIEIASQANAKGTLAAAYNNLGNIFMARKQFREAELWIEKGLAIRQELGLDADMESSRLTLANAKLQNGNFIQAKHLFLSVAHAFMENGAKEKLREIYLGLAFAYAAERKIDSLNHFLHQYDIITSELFDAESLKNAEEIEAKYQTQKKELALSQSKSQNLQDELAIQSKNRLIFIISTIAILIFAIGYFLYSRQRNRALYFEKEKRLLEEVKNLEVQNKLHAQRHEISRELHDNIGSQVTFIVSSIEALRISGISKEKMEAKLDVLFDFSAQTLAQLRDAIWAIDAKEMTFEDLKMRTLNFIEKAQLFLKGIDFEFNCAESVEGFAFDSANGINVYRIIQEAINNALKHAQASKISVDILEDHQNLLVSIKDNGPGFDAATTDFGNGLNSMELRAKELGGFLQIIHENGTEIRFMLPKQNQANA